MESINQPVRDMTPATILLLFYLLFLTLTVWIPLSLVGSYLKNKPYGLQSLLDLVAIDLIYANHVGLLSFCILAFFGIVITK